MDQLTTEWEPGMPLYPPGSYRNYFFNFRDDVDHTCVTETCTSGDAASWPTPKSHHSLPEVDEITKEVQRLRRAQAPGVAS